MTTALETAMEKHGITVKSEFVPFSKSRNADQKDDRGNTVYTLNWKVTLQRGGRDIMTTDYSAGIGHCPSYNKPVPKGFDRPVRFRQSAVAEWECENGFKAEFHQWRGFIKKLFRSPPVPGGDVERMLPRAIKPKAANVMHSLIMDASVLESGGFEDWAAELGYDTDSRKGESIYRQCLEIALKLQAGVGSVALSELREAAQDY